MKYLKSSLLAASLIFSQGAFAHSDAYLDTQPAPHGGQLRMVQQYHYELVVKANEVSVYVTDHGGKKFDTRGATGTATLLAGKSKASVKLMPAGDNQMKGSGKFELAPDMKVVVSIALAGQTALQGRFTPMQKAPSSSSTAPSH
ncbi:MAG: hypothetical protein B7X91_14920 [Hydrogenophilales bacterium 17-64-11]|nr:MAG: hypothetical protein B7X91_14920 [Hydrogenophilales bacterium 17-64-11]